MTMFTDIFKPMPGDTKAFLVENMEKLLVEMKKWVKEGLEHNPEQCIPAMAKTSDRIRVTTKPELAIDIVKEESEKSSYPDGEFKGGWIHPDTNTCDRCGFYPGSIKDIVFEYEALLGALKDLPEDYRYRGDS